MFNLFKKKSEIDVLKEQYKKVMEEAYKLSTINRTESDAKYAAADRIMNKIQMLQQ